MHRKGLRSRAAAAARQHLRVAAGHAHMAGQSGLGLKVDEAAAANSRAYMKDEK